MKRKGSGNDSEIVDVEMGDMYMKSDTNMKRYGFWHVHVPLVWITWTAVFFWGEILATKFASWNCTWADSDMNAYRLAVVADPQLTDSYSYKMKPGWVLSATELYSDMYMRRNFRQMMRGRQRPHGVLMLGDIFDGGI